jgi:hypothetical protein
VAWVGFESLPELRRLCHSEAMKAWRTGTRYERPIARRIVEESGVPRGSFGTRKRATSMSFNYGPFWWSKAALTELRELERQHLGAWREWLAYRLDGLMRTCAFTSFFAVRKLSKLVGLENRLDNLGARLVLSFHRLELTHPRYGSLAFLWGQAKIRDRYPKAGCTTEQDSFQGDACCRFAARFRPRTEAAARAPQTSPAALGSPRLGLVSLDGPPSHEAADAFSSVRPGPISGRRGR